MNKLQLYEMSEADQITILKAMTDALYKRWRDSLDELARARNGDSGLALMTEDDRMMNRLIIVFINGHQGIHEFDDAMQGWVNAVLDAKGE